jgi:hypothetical protein
VWLAVHCIIGAPPILKPRVSGSAFVTGQICDRANREKNPEIKKPGIRPGFLRMDFRKPDYKPDYLPSFAT